ncbi:transglycosylase SLT domain-containing protein [Streptomyces sp. NBS 14/10]|uniref:aggregation-promoting factor C-terminal-like domain-containing protein n=1 Tax=Streptomyces sp. NBS 14/10 TaxID=1945643 RepID=UPI000B7D34F9|nr:transglycosylase SLT domain-containing protein [Streptomyces sp. NBS 14/10]KAK1181818.1 transglycosylase SLT domain-containing protein [Streptomyces sp. NBS 14/10]NUS86971.1 transglycosylase SLT domain-containing protein [Streptomyces sp.]
MLEGNRVSRISVRGFAVASATAVTTVGAVVGVAAGGEQQSSTDPVEATAADTTLLADIPAGQQAVAQTASLTQQADVQSTAADAEAKKSAEESARKQAAKDAKAKKLAAEKAAAEAKLAKERAAEKKKLEEAASRSATRDASSFPQQASYTVAEVQAMARQIVPADQFQCFSNIVNHESTWNYRAENPSSGAYGLVQALPGSKMSSVGADWRTNPATQIKWGLNYMNERYDSPCGAWSFWQANNYY